MNYDKRNWDLIAEQLLSDAGQIPVINRAQLIDDAFNLARSGRLDYSVALNLTRYLGGEVEYLPWKAVSTALKFLDAMLGRTPIYGAFQVSLRYLNLIKLKQRELMGTFSGLRVEAGGWIVPARQRSPADGR